ncbi:MAG: ABC transporter permease [Desulfovibrionaceae bacterium]|nr:ABC transporter permease [Desulfovibrionaceae bacterium]
MDSSLRNFLRSVMTLFRKELLMILTDPRNRIILVVPLIVQTVIFGHVATYDLNNVEYALLDEDHSFSSRLLVRQFDGSPVFHRVLTLRNSSEIQDTLDSKKALMVLHIGPDFERRLATGQTAPVKVLADGRNSNTAGTAVGYATTLIARFNSEYRGGDASSLSVTTRAWFNPNLETRWGILSALSAVLAMVQTLLLAGQSVAREREQGTFDQLLVTPMGPTEIMIGKALPPILVGMFQSSLVVAVSMLIFKIPFVGSFGLLFASLLVFNIAVVGVGLCVSALSNNMQQAMLYTFTLVMPMILLGGFTTPISSMPEGFQYATLVNPLRYAVEFAQCIYLEGAGWEQVWPLLWPLLVIGVVTLTASSRLFRKTF